MDALKYKTIIKKDGEINLTGVPFKKGQEIELVISIETSSSRQIKEKKFNAVKIKTSGFTFSREAANER